MKSKIDLTMVEEIRPTTGIRLSGGELAMFVADKCPYKNHGSVMCAEHTEFDDAYACTCTGRLPEKLENRIGVLTKLPAHPSKLTKKQYKSWLKTMEICGFGGR